MESSNRSDPPQPPAAGGNHGDPPASWWITVLSIAGCVGAGLLVFLVDLLS